MEILGTIVPVIRTYPVYVDVDNEIVVDADGIPVKADPRIELRYPATKIGKAFSIEWLWCGITVARVPK